LLFLSDGKLGKLQFLQKKKEYIKLFLKYINDIKGLPIYKEAGLLYSNTNGAINNEYSVVSTIAHEVSHMWFGNWVTPKWYAFHSFRVS
jgi:hypothetical protein